MRMKEVNNHCDNLRMYIEIGFEQVIEIFGALIDIEMVKEGTGARKKMS